LGGVIGDRIGLRAMLWVAAAVDRWWHGLLVRELAFAAAAILLKRRDA
jgi:hypothetical protein